MNMIRSATVALALAFASPVWAAGLSASVNAGKVALGDTFQLTLTAQGQGGAAPDLTPLYKDFDLRGTSQSSSTQVINGRMSQSQSWIVTLAPKSTGVLTVPELTAGALSSDPARIEVLPASAMPKLQGAEGIALRASVEGDTHYRFQEIPLTVRIESAAPLQNAELIAPSGDFELTQTGQDKTGQITRGGQPVTVIERHYLLRPNSDGTLTVPPFTLRGTVPDPNARRDPMRSFGGRDPFAMMDQMMARMGGGVMRPGLPSLFAPQGQTFVARSDAITLNVQPGQTGAGTWFLPAKAVDLQAEWSDPSPVFKQGEAIQRRISLMALGARPEQLPNLTFEDAPGARVYLDDTRSDLVETEKGTVARKDFLVSVVPTRGGPVTLPEIAVDWLDTATGTQQTAILPAVTLDVEGALPAASPIVTAAPAETPALGGARVPWLWIALAAFGTAGTAFAAQRLAKRPKAPDPLRDLRRAAWRQDRAGVYAALLSLRKAHPQADLQAAQDALDKAAYADAGQTAPDLRQIAKGVTRALRQERRRNRHQARSTRLPALYPG